MMNVAFGVAACSLLLGIVALAQPVAASSRAQIIACEQAKARLLLLDANADWAREAAVVWSWSAAEAPDLTKEQARLFGYPSDAKPVLGGSHLLTCASHGAVALIRMQDRKVLFCADAGGNPHSITLLPDGNIVSASSEGGYLTLFQTKRYPEVVSQRHPFHDAHGIVWDQKRQCLWAIGGRELKRYRYDPAKPDLVEEASFILPAAAPNKAPGGHDLVLAPSGDRLFLTTIFGVYQFDPAISALTPFAPLAGMTGVKSISQYEQGGPTIIMRATEKWYSDTVRYVGEDRAKTLLGARFYKARWWPVTE